ncbi:MAG: geranylgeranylglyceryl/heptaprenylglyceryl phosphate synthase [Flavobacteriales bacterium]|nr:geranylgeranylglyceryl/heptaprenylglyceryl phosphate synthase [Flavobacteriales bacterium]
MNILKEIIKSKEEGKKQIAVLIDPDKLNTKELLSLVSKIKLSPINYILVGGSLLSSDQMDEYIGLIKQNIDIPVIIFPGSVHQISNKADGILFLSLISGRNPEFLIGSQVVAAPLLKRSKLEILSTGYVLVDSGIQTTASYISNTTPLPRDKADIAVATALASEMIGHKLLYLDGGSGAKLEVPSEMISAVKKHIDIPLIVGGGINTKSKLETAFNSGADLVVIGTAIEKNQDFLDEIVEVLSKSQY